MLSRVAAVKAPRTHNRRRVTGSRGRRREGRESEPRRPNMSRRVFASAVLLLLVVIMCCGTGEAASSKDTSGKESSRKTHFDWRDKNGGETVSSLRIPSLVELDGDVFAVAEAHCTKEGEGDFTGIASELLKLTDEQSKELVTTELKTQVLVECSEDNKGVCSIVNQAVSQKVKNVHVGRPTTVVEGSDIYMLAGNYSWTLTENDQAGDWGLMLVKGNVSKKDGENNRIYWNDNYIIPWSYHGNQGSLKRLVGSGGSGVKMEDGTLVFPLEGTKKAKKEDGTVEDDGNEKDGKTVSLIIYSKDAKSWTLSKGMSADGCSDPSVVEWKDKLMMMTACDDGRRRVYESADKGDLWTEALGTLSRVWGKKKGVRSGFITAKIDNRDVMLVTLPVCADNDKEKGKLHLWLTDNTHIADIGPVSGDDDVAASSLLYKSAGSGNSNKRLIALYEKKKGNEDTSLGMASVLLTEQLQRVKEVLKIWKEVGSRVSHLCPSESALQDPSADNACSDGKITDGLVGFLSGSFSDNTWKDEYLGVDATVNKNDNKGATKASDGVTFHGAWAEWPVGAQGQNQLYHFANYNFTLVATVSIDGERTEGNIPVMGVRADSNGEKKLIELSYDSGEKWQLLCGGAPISEKLSSTLGEKRTDLVVILLRNGSQGTAYVDGQRVGRDAQCQLENTEPKGISHFYIGGDGGSADGAGSEEGVSVTVTNVLLYNRPLNDAEITAINTNKHFIERLTDLKNVPRDTRPPGVDTQPTLAAVSESTRHGQQPSKHEPLKGEEGAGSGGASNSAETTLTTSSVGSQSAEQLPSGGSHDGNKNVNVDSSSDGNPAVGTVGGDTTQANGSPQIPVGISNTADANTPATEGEGQDGPTANPEAGASSGENGEPTEGTNGQVEEIHPHNGEVNATALSSSLGNVSQGNNSDAGTVRGSGMVPSLLLLLGLWWFAAL
ncbi:trans-sialidase [Trypanosoma cruzi cruzi]|uniref:Putative trans-sialidase, Group VI n=1 Tax=Trypanosoma cruzi TaxID=5693 RepID=A0A2V2UXC2_TRYCR|nr:trans-sialidase [Trypanosoma cruzi cruzi]PWU88895.1 putative trans-sialidase, Group VI [Trypanosoma cruzi]